MIKHLKFCFNDNDHYDHDNRHDDDDENEQGGVTVVDIYSEWSGPCTAMQTALKKIKLEVKNDHDNYEDFGDEITMTIMIMPVMKMVVITVSWGWFFRDKGKDVVNEDEDD